MAAHRRLFQIVSIVVILTMSFSGVALPPASAQGPDGIERQVNPQTGKVSFIGPEDGQFLPAFDALDKAFRPQDPVMALAKRFGPEFGLKDAERELSQIKTSQAENGRITARYQQNYQGIPVMGGELIVNTNVNGDLYSMNGEVADSLSLSTQPAIGVEQAKQIALQAVAKWYQNAPKDFVASEPELWIYEESLLRPSTRPAELVWRMEITPVDSLMPVRELVLVDAQRGSVSLHFNQIDTFWGAVQTTDLNSRLSTDATEDDAHALLGATWYVATTGHDGNSCSSAGSPCKTINAAIAKAAAGDTIKVAIGTYTGTGAEVVLIEKGITLSGGWNTAFTTQSGRSTIDGQGARRGVTVAGNNVVMDRFTIQNGFAEHQGGGLRIAGDSMTLSNSLISGNASGWMGGGIFNLGTLTINNTIINENIGGQGGGNGGGGGGGIQNYSGTLTLNNSSVSRNILLGGYSGSGIHTTGAITLNNSTVSSNTGGYGEGIYTVVGAVTLNNSTIAFNQSYGLMSQQGTVTLKNSILAMNGSRRDCYNDTNGYSGTVTSQGYNLIGNSTLCSFTPSSGDLLGSNASPVNARLAPLEDNGGSTFTHGLAIGSPAIDAGNPAAPGSGGTSCLGTDQRGVARPVGIRCDIGGYEGSVDWSPTAPISTYTAENSSSLPGTLICDEWDPNCIGGDAHAQAAHKYALGTYELYATQHLRDSIDNNGMRIVSTVHYESDYANAFWDGEQIVYGDGYGFPLADDVVAHELTHGVTEHESNLFYYYQSGAINESFSDLWGEYYDQINGLGTDIPGVKWLHGEDISGLGAGRSMSGPPAFNDPDKMSSTYYYEGEDDNGGVHTNSGVNNKAVYLMVEGGDFNGKTIMALGWEKTLAIYYEANTKLLSSGADYSDLYYALQKACSNLIGQKGITAANCAEVKDALDAVEMSGQPAPGFNPEAPLCTTAGTTPKMVFADDLETGVSNWTFSNGAYTRWQWDSPYGVFAQSGLHSLYADDYPDLVTDATARLNPLLIPSNAYLHFAHAYDFEQYQGVYYDGGVLEYSINGGSTWLDANPLIDFNKYKGPIFAGYNNPLKGRWGFVGSSHGYISTRLNLASLAGKSVMFRWRMGLDGAVPAWGWWVDNVKVYTCAIPLPSAFNKTAPAAGSINQPLNPTLRWGASSGATSYQYCYDTTNDNACTTWIGNGTSTSKVLSGLSPGTTYYWHVRALNNGGITYANGSSTAFWSFTTMPLPGAFNKTAPGNGATGVSLSTTLSWNASSSASLYQYCYDLINDNQCNRTWSSTPTTSVNIANLGTNTTYYWQVRATNIAGTTYANNQSWGSFTTTSTLPAGWTGVEAFIGTDKQGKYSLDNGQSLRESYTGVNNGPVKLGSTTSTPLIGAERVIYKVNGVNTSFTEMMGLPDSQLDTTYWLPWYNNVNLDTQLRFANVSGSPATVNITIGGQLMGDPIQLAAGASTRISFAGIDNGPVQIVSDQNIVAAERVIYKVNGGNTSFSEMMALPASQLDTTYWLPWYNNVNLDTQLRFANVHDTQTATVRVYIGGQEMEGSPFTLQPGASTRQSFEGIDDGPVQIVSDVPIVAAERVIYKVNNINTSFTEMMALPNSQLDTTYWLPWYNNVNLDTQLRFANVHGTQTATVHVYIGGVEMDGSPFTLLPDESTRQSFAGIDDGPVQIVSNVPIVAAERVIYKVNNVNTSFSEMMALPNTLLDVTYWFPWYNNVDLDTQLRFGVP
jgi:Zn-dependent metalloprotease